MLHKLISWVISLFVLLPIQGCERKPDIGVASTAVAKQVDMKVVIPVHPSSLKYFDYVVCYSDNSGEEYRDTIREKKGGITVEDWIIQEYEVTLARSRASQDCDIYYVKNHAYKALPVVCRCEVTLVPKVSRDSVVSFSYTIPKPYIFSRVIFNSHSYTPQIGNSDIEGVDILKLDSIRIGTFLSAYGSWFCSTCSVKADYDGIACTFY